VPQYLVIAFFFGLSAGVIGKIKGSSFVIWFLVGAVLPVFGTLAALFYRFERNEPRRECDECGRIMPLTDQVCRQCGADQGLPDRLLVKPG
jgi:hypothetical protein